MVEEIVGENAQAVRHGGSSTVRVSRSGLGDAENHQ